MKWTFLITTVAVAFTIFKPGVAAENFLEDEGIYIFVGTCKECHNYTSEQDYLSPENLPQLMEKACKDKDTANDLYDHFLHSCSLQYESPAPAWEPIPVFTPKEYCAEIQFEKYVLEDVKHRGVLNVTYRLMHMLCFRMQGVTHKIYEGRYRANGTLVEARLGYTKLIPTHAPGIRSIIKISSDDPKLKEALAIPSMIKRTIYLCAKNEWDEDFGNTVLCNNVIKAEGCKCK